jgi:cell division septation protein DedD
LEIVERGTDENEMLMAENQQQDTSVSVPAGEKKLQRSYFRTLPDSETYVEVEATPVKKAISEPAQNKEPQQATKETEAPKQVAKEETPIPPAQTPAAPSPRQTVAVAPALPNVPRDPSDEIRLGRQPQSSEMGGGLLSGTIYSVQVASSPDKEDSERLVRKYGEYGYQAYIMTADLGEKGIWYRVRVGNLANREEAERLKKDILNKASHLANQPYVIKVSE